MIRKWLKRAIIIGAIVLPTIAITIPGMLRFLNLLMIIQVIGFIVLVWEAKSKKSKTWSVFMAISVSLNLLAILLIAVTNSSSLWTAVNSFFTVAEVTMKVIFGLIFIFTGTKKERIFGVVYAISMFAPALGLPFQVTWALQNVWSIFISLLF